MSFRIKRDWQTPEQEEEELCKILKSDIWSRGGRVQFYAFPSTLHSWYGCKAFSTNLVAIPEETFFFSADNIAGTITFLCHGNWKDNCMSLWHCCFISFMLHFWFPPESCCFFFPPPFCACIYFRLCLCTSEIACSSLSLRKCRYHRGRKENNVHLSYKVQHNIFKRADWKERAHQSMNILLNKYINWGELRARGCSWLAFKCQGCS